MVAASLEAAYLSSTGGIKVFKAEGVTTRPKPRRGKDSAELW